MTPKMGEVAASDARCGCSRGSRGANGDAPHPPQVKFAERIFLLRAEDNYDRAFWLEKIRKAIEVTRGAAALRS